MQIELINEVELSSEIIDKITPYFDKLTAAVCDLAEQGVIDVRLRKILNDSSYAALSFIDSETIQELNRENRDIDKPTDVLSFPMIEMFNGKLESEIAPEDMEFTEDGESVLNLGDIIICPEVALKNAAEYGHSEEREILFLMAHSMLHLLGYDHIEEDDEKIMLFLQKKLMCDIGLAFEDEEAEITNHADEMPQALAENIAYPAGSPCEHCGYISILGRPNVGKSTLINYITGMKLAIVSHKPQTTRTNIRSIYNTDDSQIIFVDTPGVHNPGSKLAKIMVNNSFSSAKNADAVLLIADGRFPKPGAVEQQLIELCKQNKKKVVLAINKSDDVTKESLLPMIMAYSQLYEFIDIIPISAKTGDNVDLLIEKLTNLLPAGPRLFDSEYMTNQTEREICAELIREQILHYIDQEIPHGTCVEIQSFEEKYKSDSKDAYDREMCVIKANIVCERNSHKGIIIGKNGQMLKRIGTQARKGMERLLDCKVFLEVFVKVREDWKNNDGLLKSYGYQEEDDGK